ncbi:putative mitochondrial protein AtMg00310 [Apium graveolens]|uniref:putative mitochondrial protein AtMg00310 n=1 Tax=Apium graveolens TaxID=4045 RepID=UPI003D7A8FDE
MDKQEEISAILGVHGDITSSNYLGLPSLIGRSKKRVFGFIKEIVCKHIDSWKPKQISRSGKTFLLKNVAQFLPAYCMTCFLLPKIMMQEIERQFNAYWWCSGSGGGKGVKWMSWEGMTSPKHRGGLGFRSMHGFNIALLGKHIWRCIQNPDLIVSRVLKTRYFPHGSILTASKGVNPSFIWSGI